ncbi:hypothetical protein RRG08_051837 [Elysia crispata]|uniref:Uncharacterized protein n=1 Tax=Elysia crispata TaxID=231223 RepID=A0AAE0Z9H1_9GAST|nr:hypothetical protein RRG08_051837 [Elysia crispata]
MDGFQPYAMRSGMTVTAPRRRISQPSVKSTHGIFLALVLLALPVLRCCCNAQKQADSGKNISGTSTFEFDFLEDDIAINFVLGRKKENTLPSERPSSVANERLAVELNIFIPSVFPWFLGTHVRKLLNTGDLSS